MQVLPPKFVIAKSPWPMIHVREWFNSMQNRPLRMNIGDMKNAKAARLSMSARKTYLHDLRTVVGDSNGARTLKFHVPPWHSDQLVGRSGLAIGRALNSKPCFGGEGCRLPRVLRPLVDAPRGRVVNRGGRAGRKRLAPAGAAQVRGRSFDGAGSHRFDHRIVRAVLASRVARRRV